MESRVLGKHSSVYEPGWCTKRGRFEPFPVWNGVALRYLTTGAMSLGFLRTQTGFKPQSFNTSTRDGPESFTSSCSGDGFSYERRSIS